MIRLTEFFSFLHRCVSVFKEFSHKLLELKYINAVVLVQINITFIRISEPQFLSLFVDPDNCSRYTETSFEFPSKNVTFRMLAPVTQEIHRLWYSYSKKLSRGPGIFSSVLCPSSCDLSQSSNCICA